MKRLVFAGIVILTIAISTTVYAVDDLFVYDISMKCQGINYAELSELQAYIKNREKDLVLDLEGGILAFNTDLKKGIVFSTGEGYVLGILENEYMDFSAHEDTASCYFDRETANGEYTLGLDYIKQVISEICFGRYFDFSENIRIGLIGKHFRGRKLERQYYEGIIERKEQKNFLTGRRVTVDSGFHRKTALFDLDFKAGGWGIDLYTEWVIDENSNILLSLRNIYSKIIWEDVFNEYMNYNRASLGLFDNDSEGESSSGFFEFRVYETVVPEEYDLKYQNGKYTIGIKYYDKEYLPYFDYQLTDYLSLGFCENQGHFSFISDMIEIAVSTDDVNILEAEEAAFKFILNFSF